MDIEKLAKNFLEISSEQRLNILYNILERQYNISDMATKLDATKPEVHRNFHRLVRAGLIQKNPDSKYSLTTSGQLLCKQIPSIFFVYDNMKFFNNHDFDKTPLKFIQRIGAINEKTHIQGFVKVLEKWKKIHENAEEYIYNILSEVPYSKDIIDAVESKLEKGIKIKSIFAEDAIVPDERTKIFKKKNFEKFIKEGLLERKMNQIIPAVVLLNERESCVIFSESDGNSDMHEMFYSQDPEFHEWCLDFFMHYWNNSSTFQESKLK